MEKQSISLTQAVAAELRAERSAKLITFEALAEATGFSKSAISNWLKGSRDLKIPDLDRIAGALGVSIQVIVARAMERMEEEG